MTALPPPRPSLLWQPRDYTIWDANRDRIYEYYLIGDNTLDKTKRLMEEFYEFPEFPKATWEHVLHGHFKFRKNLDRDDWAPIGQSLAERLRNGRTTHAIYLCGKPLPNRRVKKNVSRISTFHSRSPNLPRDIVIRTPPPHTRTLPSRETFTSREVRRDMYLSDLPRASSSDVPFIKDMLPEWILEVRKNSPFNETLLRLQLFLESHVVTDNDLRQSFASLSQMYRQCSSPSLFGTSSSLDILSYACFSMSRGSRSGFSEPLPLLKWIGKVADLSFLRGIFSANTPTLLEFWSRLLETAWLFSNLDAFRSLFEVSPSLAHGQWAQVYLKICDSGLPFPVEEPSHRPLLEHMSKVIRTGWFANDKTIRPCLVLKAALQTHDLSMMKFLASLGYHISGLPVEEQQDHLQNFTVYGESQQDTCLRYMLENGVAAAPVLEDGVYWHGPNSPVLARDQLWILVCSSNRDSTLLDEFYRSGLREDEIVTASAIYKAASGGLDSLRHYMETTPCSTVDTKTVLLEITLSETAALGCCDVIGCLLDYGVDPNVPSLGRDELSGPKSFPYEWNPIQRAISCGKLEVVKILYHSHSSLDCHDSFLSVLSQVTDDFWIDTIELLQTFGLDPQGFGDSEVVQAAVSSYLRCGMSFEALLDDESARVVQEKKEENLRLCLLMLKRGVTWPVKMRRCKANLIVLLLQARANDSLIFSALDAGYDLDLQGQEDPNTPLMAAIETGRLDLALEFIRRGADVNGAIPHDNKHWSITGTTALQAACYHGAPLSFLETLFDLGAQVNAGSQLEAPTSLCYAITAGHLNITSLLIAHGADINTPVTDRYSWPYSSMVPGETWSPLDIAAATGNLEITQLFYDLGGRSAFRMSTEVDGAVQLARRGHCLGVLRFFEERLGGLDEVPDLE
ncbi:hypothetical protein PG993_002360 [Apiospora rasikravindrae]|uniref:Clr5 domain-containing protein n=1 Tax=Apiospora rasikravindrae TaxID=990691 RepID=A0ABR1TYN9_9PEZI